MYTKKILNAIEYAAEAHKHQKRKSDGSSYICHPIRVMNLLQNYDGGDLMVMTAAVLHDVVEDTDATLDDIQKRFGDQVATLVEWVSDDRSLSKVERKKAQVVKAKKAPEDARAIKGADMLDNLRNLVDNPPGDWTPQLIHGYAVWKYTIWTNGVQGVYPWLDKQLTEVFDRLIPDRTNLATHLDEYYQSLEAPQPLSQSES